MSGIFGGPKIPKPQPTPAQPQPDEAQATADETDRLRRRRGVAANILSRGPGQAQGSLSLGSSRVGVATLSGSA